MVHAVENRGPSDIERRGGNINICIVIYQTHLKMVHALYKLNEAAVQDEREQKGNFENLIVTTSFCMSIIICSIDVENWKQNKSLIEALHFIQTFSSKENHDLNLSSANHVC